MRDDKWLFQKLDEVWDKYFSDVPQDNDVKIVWGRRARTRLGSIRRGQNIKAKHPETIITINSLFKDGKIPEYVVVGTIAHELTHYAHGFHSPLAQKFITPHAGGVIRKEFFGRGLVEVHKKQKKWLKENWKNYLVSHMPQRKPRRRIVIKWI